jgi:hypothetical protein
MALGEALMPMKLVVTAMLFLLGLSGCGDGTPGPPKLPYRAWHVGLAAPRHMEIWVESVDVLDQRGYAFFNVHGGVAGYTSKPEGWHAGGGASIPATDVDLPERIFVRWQSLAEQKTYKIGIEIPQWVRDEMVMPHRIWCEPAKREMLLYRDTINLGMAPGGIVKVWYGGGCLGYTELGRYQANIEPLGPYKGETQGRYVPMEPEAKAYVDKHGIPYGSW